MPLDHHGNAGFYKADGACVECPDNSCSPAGSTSVDSCKCFEGYFFNATDPDSPECTTCPPHTTSRRGSSSPEECSYDCGLPPAPVTLGKELEALAKEADAAEAVRQRALRIVEASIRAKDAAVKALNKQVFSPFFSFFSFFLFFFFPLLFGCFIYLFVVTAKGGL